jgi:hypothetical protein
MLKLFPMSRNKIFAMWVNPTCPFTALLCIFLSSTSLSLDPRIFPSLYPSPPHPAASPLQTVSGVGGFFHRAVLLLLVHVLREAVGPKADGFLLKEVRSHLKGQCHHTFWLLFYQRTSAGPSEAPRKDFESHRIFTELFVLVIDSPVNLPTASRPELVYKKNLKLPKKSLEI